MTRTPTRYGRRWSGKRLRGTGRSAPGSCMNLEQSADGNDECEEMGDDGDDGA